VHALFGSRSECLQAPESTGSGTTLGGHATRPIFIKKNKSDELFEKSENLVNCMMFAMCSVIIHLLISLVPCEVLGYYYSESIEIADIISLLIAAILPLLYLIREYELTHRACLFYSGFLIANLLCVGPELLLSEDGYNTTWHYFHFIRIACTLMIAEIYMFLTL
jgi:hypothetical protein